MTPDQETTVWGIDLARQDYTVAVGLNADGQVSSTAVTIYARPGETIQEALDRVAREPFSGS